MRAGLGALAGVPRGVRCWAAGCRGSCGPAGAAAGLWRARALGCAGSARQPRCRWAACNALATAARSTTATATTHHPRRAKIVEGRLDKIKKTFAVMEKESLRDPTKSVTEILKETIAAVGENIKIRCAACWRGRVAGAAPQLLCKQCASRMAGCALHPVPYSPGCSAAPAAPACTCLHRA